MHYKKRKLHKLHSIPIGLCNKVNHNRLYLVSYSIPLSCMVILLLGLGLMINPGLFLVDKSSAVTIQDEWVVENKDSKSTTSQNIGDDNISDDTASNNTIHNEVGETSAGGFDDIEKSVGQDISEDVASEYGIMPLVEAGITFSIGGADKDATIEATPGVVAYREHTVTVNLTNADEYAMFISGNSDIVLDTNNAAKLVGMTNATAGSDIPAGEWGYGWDYTGSKSKEEMTYQAVPSTQTEILTPNIDATTNTVSFTGKLNFAGKFPEGAAVGNYTGGTATLALVVSPKGTTAGALWKRADGSNSNYYSGIHTMQEIDTVTRDGGFCKNNPIVQTGWTIELQDNRGENPVTSYKIVKLRDGSCWMQQNLQLNLTKNTPIEGSTSSGAAHSWTVPNLDTATTQAYSTSGTWTSDNTAVMSRAGSGTNGNYYTWCAATAGTCSSATSDGAVASASICPKGWKLPTGNTNGEFYNLLNGVGRPAVTQSPYLFPYAGYVHSNGSLDRVGSYGRYWSSTANSGTSAYGLAFSSDGGISLATGDYNRCYGSSVRCVATY